MGTKGMVIDLEALGSEIKLLYNVLPYPRHFGKGKARHTRAPRSLKSLEVKSDEPKEQWV